MRDPQLPVTIYRADYQAPNHRITTTHLEFDLVAQATRVSSRLEYAAWGPNSADDTLVLDGEALHLISVKLNGEVLSAQAYKRTDTTLEIPGAGFSGVVEIVVEIEPDKNTRLEGLYVSNGNFFTQCEAQGFRRITYFPDRPDVLSRFTVTLRADAQRYPVLLSNGNLLEQTTLPDGRLQARWEDPFPKPAYLFALVAGQFVCQEETIEKSNGKNALLQVWVEPGNLDKTDFAMQSLKRSIEWDRKRFALDLDLDRFMIVATADFNMGAMENKGLNIFNTKFVFANPDLATDVDFENVESVVGHEYFHNWTGNRVTCRDWFQLSLKEGLTVFRDQEFSADMQTEGLSPDQAASARAVKRIDDVKVLRAAQFPEDAGPMAHPIRPDSYQEINNFYTVTVYEKGAEVIRMQHTLLGETTFQRGMQIYFERHDGHAVTCEDFVSAMETAYAEAHPNSDLKQFRHWYSQAGTPHVQASWTSDTTRGELRLHLKQSCKPTPGQMLKPEFHIPLKMGLVGPDGKDLPLHAQGVTDAQGNPMRTDEVLKGDILNLTSREQTIVFSGIYSAAIPSIARGFSAPIVLNTSHSTEELIFLASHDSDPFNRWDAAQKIYTQAILDIYANEGALESAIVEAARSVFGNFLSDPKLSDAYLALNISLPGEGTLFEQVDGLVDPTALHFARCELRDLLSVEFEEQLGQIYQARHAASGTYHYNAIEAGRRSLKNMALSYLVSTGGDDALALAKTQFAQADNMTDRIASLSALVHNTPDCEAELNAFYERHKTEALAVDKWFMVQATAPVSLDLERPFERVQELLKHPAFILKNPNRARSVIAALCMQNLGLFHHHSAEGYTLWAEWVTVLNALNPQVAARMSRALDRWTKLVPDLQVKAQSALESVYRLPDLSPDVREVVGKALSANTH